MRETRSSGSVEGVMGNHDSYSDSFEPVGYDAQRRTELDAKIGGRWHERPLSEPIAPCPAPPSQERSVSSRGSLRQFDPTVELIVGILTPRLEPIARFCGFAQKPSESGGFSCSAASDCSQIAKAPAICELIFATVFNEVVHLLTDSICIYKYSAKKISLAACESRTSAQL